MVWVNHMRDCRLWLPCFSEGGLFEAELVFPEDFPNNPPDMKFTSEMWHPNIYEDGRVCISILHPPGHDRFNELVRSLPTNYSALPM